MSEQLFQALRCRLTGEEIDVPVQNDTATNEMFVFWSDIQDGFENAKSVRNGRALVPFVKDNDGNQIKPRRIGYYPGIVLEVVTASDAQSTSTCAVVDVAKATSEVVELDNQGNDPSDQPFVNGIIHFNSTDYNSFSLTTTDMDTISQELIKYSDGSRPSSHNYSHLHGSSLPTTTSEQSIRVTDIKKSLDQLQVDRGKNEVFQGQMIEGLRWMLQEQQQTRKEQQQTREELLEKLRQVEQLQEKTEQSLDKKHQETLDLQEHILHLQRSTKEEVLKKQEEMLEMQRQTLDSLVIIMSRIQALLTQTYELHEYPIPRLFIVLPKSTGLRMAGLFSEQFRLYFLCECGIHTTPEGSKTPHEVHLAKHEGYDLDRPKEFFEKYGTYVLAMMCMIKYGVTAAGIIVPPLANLKVVDGLESTLKHLEYLKKNIIPLVNDTITFLQDYKINGEIGTEMSTKNTEYGKLEALEGADLRQLESFLKIKDEGRVLGHLYRIVTPEGHVRWVCVDHYHASYRESAMKHLRDVVGVNKGRFMEEKGRIEIEIMTNLQARHFYEAMIKARGIQELEIKLKWDATMSELRELSGAVTSSNVTQLTVNGICFKSPAIDVVNRGQRFDPILQLASNTRVQSLQLNGFDDFFTRVTKYKLPAPKLRVFSMDWNVSLDDKAAVKFFNGFLGHCSGLAALELRVHQRYLTTKAFMDAFTTIHKLKSFMVDYGGFSIATSFLRGHIQDVSITIPELSPINSADLQFIGQSSFTQLIIESVPPGDDGDKITAILSQNQELNSFRIGGKRSSDAGSRGEMRLQDVMQLFAPATSSKLESLLIDYGRFTLSAKVLNRVVQDMTMRFGKLKSLTSDDFQFIQQGSYSHLRIEYTQKDDEHRLTYILRQSLALNYRQLSFHGDHRVAIGTTTDTGLHDLVNLATSEASHILESISVGCRRLTLMARHTQGMLHDMAMEIEQLGSLDCSDLAFIHEGHLTRLVIESIPLSIDEDRLADIFRHNPRLIQLQIQHCSESDASLEFPIQKLMKLTTSETLSQLQSFSVNYGRFAVTMTSLEGKAQAMTMTFEQIDALTPDDIKFIQEGPYSQLRIEHTRAQDEGPLISILRRSSVIGYIQIRRHGEHPAITATVGMPIQDLVNMAISKASSTLELVSICCRGLTVTGSYSQGTLHDVAMSVDRLGSMDPNDLAFIHQGHLTQLIIESTPVLNDEDRLRDILRHNPMLIRLEVQAQGRSKSVPSLDLPLQKLMELTTSEILSRLQSFSINYGRFAVTSLEGKAQVMTMTFEQIDVLTPDDIKFIQEGPYCQLRMEFTQEKDEEPLISILRRSSVIGYIQIRRRGERPAITATIGMPIQDLVYLAISETPSALDSFSVGCQRFSLSASVLQGEIQRMAMDIEHLANLTPDDLALVHQGHLTRLVIASAPLLEDEDRLANILRHNPMLTRLEIQGQGCPESVTSPELPLQSLMKLMTLEASSAFENFSVGYRRFSLTTGISQGKTLDMVMTIDRFDNLTFSDTEFIHQGLLNQFVIKSAPLLEDETRLVDVLRHNPMLIRLKIQHRDGSNRDANLEIPLQNLVKLVTSETSGALEIFSVDCPRLTLSAGVLRGKIQEMALTIKQQDNLISVDLTYFRQGYLTHSAIESDLSEVKNCQPGILSHCPGLKRLQIKSEHSLSRAAESSVEFQDVMDMVYLDTLTGLETLTIDYRNISITAGLVQCGIQDMAVQIKRLSDLGFDYLKVIQDNRITKLATTHIPQEGDESQFTEILSKCPLLSHLQVGCEWKHTLIIINMVLSVREKIIKQGSPFSLRTLDFVDQDHTPFDVLASRDDNTHIQCHLSFPKDSKSFDMRTWIGLQTGMWRADPVSDFIFQYGWSIVFFDGCLEDCNILTTFNNMPNTETPRLESLMADSRDMIAQLSTRRHSLTPYKDLGLYVGNILGGQIQTLSLLRQYGAILSKLHIYGSDSVFFSSVAFTFPTRDNFPALESFELWPFESTIIPPNYTPWIVAMVSAPPQSLASLPASQHPPQDTGTGGQINHGASGSPRSWTPLKKVMLRRVELWPEEWRRIIEALDVSALEYLDLKWSNIVQEQFEMLVNRVTSNIEPNMTFKTIDIRDTNLAQTNGSGTLDAIFARLRKWAPLVKIIV
ncbi:MAG: hypothetical protein J3Q66DRAFT_418262 [Benniella sp.]|nr:MAG: hypothetical protein J3Q66DRAFT_418262 [Benniella sp.]